jgi:hypothetical protein
MEVAMKERRVGLGRNRTVVGLAVLCACAGTVFANITNTVPYSESFESVMAGTMLTGTNGWYGVSNAVQVVEEDPGFNLGYPLSGDHTKVLDLTDSVSNLFVVGETDGSGGAPGGVHNPPWVTKETFIDMMVKPVPRDSAPANLDTNVQVAVYLDTDGHLNIYHRYMENYDLEPDQGEMEGVWSTLTNGPAIPTGTWFRLTITIGYVRDPWSGSYPDANNQYDTYYSRSMAASASWVSTGTASPTRLTIPRDGTSRSGAARGSSWPTRAPTATPTTPATG